MAQTAAQLSDIPWESALCITGHRPEKLPSGKQLEALKRTLRYYIDMAVSMGYTHFFNGIADGIDYYAAEYLFRLRETDPRLKVICIQPCEDYEQFFRKCGYSNEHLQEMLEGADELVVLPGSSGKQGIFLARDRFMVNRSSGILAVCREERSGSLYTYRYAVKQKLSACRIYPEMPDGSTPVPEQWRVDRYGF